jgi:colanic acid/amylovoran biosynthesis glycosyltransferase
MKIAFIVNKFPSLSQTFVLNQITGLLERGHDVAIYAKSPGDHLVMHADVERYSLLDRTIYYQAAPQIIPANKFLRPIKAIGLVITNLHKKPLPLLKSLNVFKFGRKAVSFKSVYETIVLLDKIDECDIVHCHFGPNGNLGAWLKDIGAITGKVVTTFHGYDITKRIKKRGDRTYDHLFEVGDLFLPISERWKNELIKLGCEEQKTVVHRMGIDTSRFSFSPRQMRKDGHVQLLTVARLVEKKGVEYGVRTVAKVLKKYPQIEYKIAGDGPLRDDIKSLIEKLNITDKVKLLGWQRQEEIVELMKEADILLAPSVTSEDGDQEGIPVVLMEALAQGLPVLSTQHSGIPELVQDGKSGLLLPERDVEALAERLEYLVEHPEIWPEMGRAGRDYVERHYDINKLNDQLVQLYQQLLDGELP